MWFKNWDQIVKNGATPELMKKREDALLILSSALDAINPYNVVKKNIKQNYF